MKRIKKFLSLTLALVMVLALTLPAFAAEEVTVGNSSFQATFSEVVSQETVPGDDGPAVLVTAKVGTVVKMNRIVTFYTGAVREEDQVHYTTWSGPSSAFEPESETFTLTESMIGLWGMESGFVLFIKVVADGSSAQPSTPAQAEQPAAQPEQPATPAEQPSTPAVPEQPTQPETPAQPDAPVEAGTYTAKKYDTWGQLALNNYGTYAVWSQLMRANGNKTVKEGMTVTLPEKVGSHSLLPAQVLAEGETLYTVKAGDTLGKIALAAYGDSNLYKVIFERNKDRLTSATMIYEGQTLVLPVKSVAEKPAQTEQPEQPAQNEQPAGQQPVSFAKGDKVTVREGAKTYTGGGLAKFVYRNTYTVISVKGDCVVIGINGVVTAAMNTADLVPSK